MLPTNPLVVAGNVNRPIKRPFPFLVFHRKAAQNIIFVFLLILTVSFASRASAGNITGIVTFAGAKPDRKPIAGVSANAFCKEACAGKEMLSDRFIFGKNGDQDTLANVLVYVSAGLEGKKFDAPKDPVVVDQVHCIYTPHVSAAMVGQTVEIRNSDATLHNVMVQPKKNKSFNEGMPGTARKLSKVFDHPELGVDMRCFMHPWMLGYIHILEHPFYAITGENGLFEIKGLPPGKYEVAVWHEYSRFAPEVPKVTVTVGENDGQKVGFAFHQKSE